MPYTSRMVGVDFDGILRLGSGQQQLAATTRTNEARKETPPAFRARYGVTPGENRRQTTVAPKRA
jgi:hypothetical protein